MDVLCSGEKELEVRAMEGLKPKRFSQETEEDVSKHDSFVMPI
jgi:hypothetical protein